MELIDWISADTVVEGDIIIFDGSPAEIIRIDDEINQITFISEDDREAVYAPFDTVGIYGYTA